MEGYAMQTQTRLPLKVMLFTVALCVTTHQSCRPKKAKNGIGTFPDIASIALQMAPILGSTSANVSAADAQTLEALNFAASSEWPEVNSNGKLKDLFGDPAQEPQELFRFIPMLNDLKDTIKEVNEVYSIVDDGKKHNPCLEVKNDAIIPLPWFASHEQKSFFKFGWEPSTPYGCAFNKDNGRVYFSQIPVEERDKVTCPEDPHTYHFLKGIRWARENAINVAERGPGYEISQAIQIYYDACQKNLHVISAQVLRYSTGIEFRTRIEFKGTGAQHEFALRGIKVETEKLGKNPKYFTTQGFGNTRVTSGAGNFIMSYQDYEGETETQVTSKIFCLASGTSLHQFTAVGGEKCSAQIEGFKQIPALTIQQVPSAPFDTKF